MDQDEQYVELLHDKFRRPKNHDKCYDEAYEGLCEHIHFEMKWDETRDHLERIAEIYQSTGDMKDKYAQISDIFDAIVSREAQKRCEDD